MSGGERFLFRPFFGEASRRSPQPAPCPPASLSQEDNSDRNPFSNPPELARPLAPTGAQSGGGGAAPRFRPPPSPREGVEVPAGRGAAGLSLPPAPDARARPANACGVVCVCVSHASPPSPNRPPQQFAIPYKFGNRFLKNSMTHNGDGAGEDSGTGAPNLRVTDCKNLGRRRGRRRPPLHQSAQIRAGPGGASRDRGRAGPRRQAQSEPPCIDICVFLLLVVVFFAFYCF